MANTDGRSLDRKLGEHIVIDSTNIPDNVVIQSDIGPNSIGNTEMADDAIDSAEIADGAVDLVHMSDNSVDSDQYIDGSVDNAHIANTTIEGGKVSVFQSAAIDGTGGEVDTAHGLGRTPVIVIVYLVQKDTGATVEIVEGAHDGTNIKVNAPAEVKYRIVAF